jgi:hypothetical protein
LLRQVLDTPATWLWYYFGGHIPAEAFQTCAFLVRTFARLAMSPASFIMSYRLTDAALFKPPVAADLLIVMIIQSVQSIPAMHF